MKMLIKLPIIIMTLTSFVACTSTTLIRTTDSEAKIFVDGEYKGKGQYMHSDSKMVGSVTSVRVEKENCEPQFFNFARNEEFDVGACVGGFFFLVPFLWIQKYKAERTYEYTCSQKR
jgi:hypothetical protein